MSAESSAAPYGADAGREHRQSLGISVGTLLTWVQQAARILTCILKPVETASMTALGRATVLHSDERNVREAGRLAWAQVTSTDRLPHYAIHLKRGSAAPDAIGILPVYRGVSVHDGWKPYRAHTPCRHALCTIHHLRELTFLAEQYQQSWAKDLKHLLVEMKAATDHAHAQGQVTLPASQREAFVACYHALLEAGRAANPPLPRGARGRRKHSPARNLLERLVLDQAPVLAFLDDLAILFGNNQAERDLRRLKGQQKVSRSFRAPSGAAAFARIRGYLSSLAKQGHPLLAALETVFADQPLYPTFLNCCQLSTYCIDRERRAA